MPNNPNKIPDDIKGAYNGFIMSLTKGIVEDERWDWDLSEISDTQRKEYKEALFEPWLIRTTLAIFSNNLKIDSNGYILNYDDARYRGLQFFRSSMGWKDYNDDDAPSFEQWETEEPDWRLWEP